MQIYEILKNIELENHSAKRDEVYTKRQIFKKYAMKKNALMDVIKRIDTTEPSRLNYFVSIQNYHGKDMYYLEFQFEENKKIGIPNKTFRFHLPLNSIDVTKAKKYIGVIENAKEYN